MWGLKNRTAYAAERNWTRDKDGVHWWLVAVKATFDIAPGGRLVLADEQQPPVLVPEYFGEPGQSSLRYDSDLLAAKPGTDVLVLAHAHAPRGRAVPTVPVSFRIERLHKELLVHGERLYESGWRSVTMTRPQPFTTRPIRYEFAFGGSELSDPEPQKHHIDERNPIGRGFAQQAAHVVGRLAHAIEYPRGDSAEMGPAGFGPIDSSWMPRRKLAGTYDTRWAQSKKPLLPDDFDPAFAPGSCAAQKVIVFVWDNGAYPGALTEEWFHTKKAKTSAPIRFRDARTENVEVKVEAFGHGETVPPCRTCELILPVMLCPGDDKEAQCQHKD